MRVFLLMACLFLLMALLYSFYLTNQISKYAIEEGDLITSIRLNHLKSTLETTLQRLKVSSLKLYQDRNVGYWLTQSGSDSYLDHLADVTLNDFRISERLFQEVYLFNLTTQKALTAQGGVISFDQFPDKQFLQQIISESEGTFNFSNQMLNEKKELILILPNKGMNLTPQGRLVILLDKKQFTEDLLLSNNEFQSKLLLLDSKNTSLISDASPQFEQAFIQDRDMKESRWKYDGQEWGVQSVELLTDEWNLHLISPLGIWKDKLFALNFKVLGSFFVMIILLLVILYFLSKQNYKPFVELLQKIRIYNGTKQEDEMGSWSSLSKGYQLIHTVIDTLVDRVEEQDRSLKNSGHVVKEDLLRQWIFSYTVGPSLREELQRIMIIKLDDPIRLAVFRIENYSKFCLKYNFQSRKLMKFAMQNIISEILGNYGINSETADMGDDHIVVIISSHDVENDALTGFKAILEEAKNQVDRWIEIPVAVGLSDPILLTDNIHEAYQLTNELSKLSFITGENIIYIPSDLKQIYKEDKTYDLNNDQVSALIQSTRVQDKNAIHKLLSNLFHQLQALPANESKLQLIQFLYALHKSFKQLDISGGIEGISHRLDEFNNLREVRVWIEQLLAKLMERMSNSRTQKEDIFPEIIEYIANHMHNPVLTVEDISDHVSISTNYVRLLFKEKYNISISDFILECRTEKVKELLVNTKWSIAEISTQSGFQSKSHFFTAFKKATGMTPSQYREERSQDKSS